MNGTADACVTWASEVRFQQRIGSPVVGVPIPDGMNTTAIYAGGVMKEAPHPDAAVKWLTFLKSEKAQAVYCQFGFKPAPQQNNQKGPRPDCE
jgi:ABC-type Fe3+ transport system substrate-binding protein